MKNVSDKLIAKIEAHIFI